MNKLIMPIEYHGHIFKVEVFDIEQKENGYYVFWWQAKTGSELTDYLIHNTSSISDKVYEKISSELGATLRDARRADDETLYALLKAQEEGGIADELSMDPKTPLATGNLAMFL